MKRYSELTKKELANLTETEIQNYIALEIAYAGIIPESAPISPIDALKDKIKKEVTAYCVRGVYFKTQEDALIFARMITYSPDYLSSCYEYKYLTEDNKNDIRTEFFYNEEDVKKYRAEVNALAKKKADYDEADRAYNAYVKKVNIIREAFDSVYDEAIRFYAKLEKAKGLFSKYTALVGEQAAELLLTDTYKGEDEEFLTELNTIFLTKES